jgi:hypothetical protein
MKNALDTARTANNGTGRCPSRSEGHRERWHPLNIVLGTPENPVAASQQRAGRYRVTMVMLRYCSVGVPKEFRRSSEGVPKDYPGASGGNLVAKQCFRRAPTY